MSSPAIFTTNEIPNSSTTTFIVQTQPDFKVIPGYVGSFSRGASRVLGALQLFMACISFTGATLAIIYYAANYYYCDGYWCGFFFIISGSLSISAARWSTKPKIKSAMAFSLISLAFAATQFGISLDGLIYNINNPDENEYMCWWWGYYVTCWYNYPAMEAANGLLVAAAGVQMLLNIAEFYICCKAICCTSHVQQQQQQVQHQMNNGQVLIEMQQQNGATIIIAQQQQQQPQQGSFQPPIYAYPYPQQPPYAPEYSAAAPPPYTAK